MTPFLAVLGRGDAASFKAAEALNLLLAALGDHDGPHHDGWDRSQATDADGAARDIKRFPRLWLARLDRAAEGGQFSKKTAAEIADRILTTDAPADLMGEGDDVRHAAV